MAALIFVSFWDRFWEAQCAANRALAITKRHFAVFEKVDFWIPFGLHFGACGAPLTLMWRTLGAKSLKMSVKRAMKNKLRKMF